MPIARWRRLATRRVAPGCPARGPAGSPRADTWDITERFNKSDWSPLPEGNDYSYVPTADWVDNAKVTAYYYGDLVWGTEP